MVTQRVEVPRTHDGDDITSRPGGREAVGHVVSAGLGPLAHESVPEFADEARRRAVDPDDVVCLGGLDGRA